MGAGPRGGRCRPRRAPAPSPTAPAVAAAILTARPLPLDSDYSDTRRPGPAALSGSARHPGAALVTSASPHFCPRTGFSEVSEAMLGGGQNVPESPGRAGGVGMGVGRAVVVVDSRCLVATTTVAMAPPFPSPGQLLLPTLLTSRAGAGSRVIGGPGLCR